MGGKHISHEQNTPDQSGHPPISYGTRYQIGMGRGNPSLTYLARGNPPRTYLSTADG